MCFRAMIDRAAEREGEALERLSELTGDPVPMSRFKHWLFEGREARRLGLKPPPRNRGHYQKLNAIRAFDRIARGEIGKREIVTREDKERRLRQRMKKLSLLLALKQMPRHSPPVDIAMACKLAGAAQRTIYKGINRGDIQPISKGWRNGCLIRPADLKVFLERQLHPRVNRKLVPITRFTHSVAV